MKDTEILGFACGLLIGLILAMVVSLLVFPKPAWPYTITFEWSGQLPVGTVTKTPPRDFMTSHRRDDNDWHWDWHWDGVNNDWDWNCDWYDGGKKEG